MNHSIKIGLSFGLTSGVITTLGLIVGLYSGTHSTAVIIGGILTIAIADACSDAFGIHLSEESENVHTHKEVWLSTLATFFFKFVFTLTFLVPILALELKTAVWASILWGVFLMSGYNFFLARQQKKNPLPIIAEHLAVSVLVIIATFYVGKIIESF